MIFHMNFFFTCIKSQLFCAVLNRNSNTTPSSVNSAINKFSFRFMVVYYEGWRTVILKSVENNQLIRVSWKKKPIYKPLLHLLGLEKTPIFYNDAPCGWAVHWRKIVLCIRKERKKSRVNKNPLNFCSLVFIERSQNYEEAYQHNKHLAIHCENLTQVISGV